MTRKANDKNSDQSGTPAWSEPKILLRETLTEAWERERGGKPEGEAELTGSEGEEAGEAGGNTQATTQEGAKREPLPGEAGSAFNVLRVQTPSGAEGQASALKTAQWAMTRGYELLLVTQSNGGFFVRVVYPGTSALAPGSAETGSAETTQSAEETGAEE